MSFSPNELSSRDGGKLGTTNLLFVFLLFFLWWLKGPWTNKLYGHSNITIICDVSFTPFVSGSSPHVGSWLHEVLFLWVKRLLHYSPEVNIALFTTFVGVHLCVEKTFLLLKLNKLLKTGLQAESRPVYLSPEEIHTTMTLLLEYQETGRKFASGRCWHCLISPQCLKLRNLHE